MPAEIERIFLLRSDSWRGRVSQSLRITQGYLSRDPERTVRVRISGEQAWMTIKGKTQGISRSEIEFPLPVETAKELIRSVFSP